MILAGENAEPTLRMIRGSDLIRPYLFKNPTYRYEEEIRFVFGIHPGLVQEDSTHAAPRPKGILIEIDCETLRPAMQISPEIPRDEFEIIGDLFTGVLGKNIQFPRYPAPNDEEWKLRYAAIAGSPFTMKDEPTGLFQDLEQPSS